MNRLPYISREMHIVRTYKKTAKNTDEKQHLPESRKKKENKLVKYPTNKGG